MCEQGAVRADLLAGGPSAKHSWPEFGLRERGEGAWGSRDVPLQAKLKAKARLEGYVQGLQPRNRHHGAR